MEEDFIIREVVPQDVEGLSNLYDRVWPGARGRHLAKTAWAVKTSEYPGFCCEKDGRIIGSRTSFHTNTYIGKEKVTCVQFGDSCVDQDFRRFGLFTRMNKAFLEQYFNCGGELIYNVSVDASRKAYEKLGWRYIESLSNIIYIPRPISFMLKSKGNIASLSGNMLAEHCAAPDVSIISENLLLNRESIFEDNNCIHTRYDMATLLWRVKSDSNIKLINVEGLGACLYKTGFKKGLYCCSIGEIFLKSYSYKNFKSLFRIIEHNTHADVYNTVITHAHPLYSWYRREGFICNPRKVFLNHGVKVVAERMGVICYNPNNWALSYLDIDTF